jgi:hypothetical protein
MSVSSWLSYNCIKVDCKEVLERLPHPVQERTRIRKSFSILIARLQRERQLVQAIRGDRNLQLKAEWEEKTDKTIQKNTLRNAIEDIKKRKATDLNARRARLAELLKNEDK